MQKLISKIKIPKGRELRASVFMTLGTLVLIYMVVSTIQAVWQNYKLDKELLSLKEETAQLTLKNKYLENLIQYRKTDSFKDKEARAKLNYQKPGETVFIIPEDNAIEQFTEGNTKDENSAAIEERELTNPEKWWKFIFS